MSDALTPPQVIEWAVRGQPISGELESGDLHLVAEFAGGALLGLIDGLGHGREAAIAARAAQAVLGAHPYRSLPTLIQDCHQALRSTRGAVLSLASIDTRRDMLCWGGVGNVEAVLNRADASMAPRHERILLRSGVVGYQLPPLRAMELPIFPGDVLIFASDGLRHDFAEEPPARLNPAEHADYLIRTYGKDSDDALVLVARYRGAAA
jgi:hypothetical protein